MHVRSLVFAAATMFGSTGCKSVDCGEGTIERNGTCVAADETVGIGQCGPFTELIGDQCVPMFPPTLCGPGTVPDIDDDGVTTCVGDGSSAGCGAPLACPPGTNGRQTICGQLYDLATNEPFAAPGATGARCTTPTASGPCSVDLHVYDAVVFGMNPATAPRLPPTDTDGNVFLDDCGRFRIPDITIPATNPLIAIGVDDVDSAGIPSPMGTTVAVGVATPKAANTATKNVEAFVASLATVGGWQATGGPPFSGGMAMSIFRAGKTGLANQSGVTVTRNGATIMNNAFYFAAGDVGHTMISTAQSTGANGSALITGANVLEGQVYSAQKGPLPATCKWESHGAVSLPGIVFVQIYRPINDGGACSL